MQSRRTPRGQQIDVDVDPHRHLSYVIAKVGHQLQHRIGRALSTQGITLTQFSALAHISRSPGLSNADLARAMLTTPQATTTLVRRLTDAGLVERPGVAPGLAGTIWLTTRGIGTLKGSDEIATQAEAEALNKAISPAEQGRLLTMLRDLSAALERRETDE